ncbi:hypothetical protein ASE09_20665 [Streptomyces sp. Root66D1]|nr:hypothetical protein ASD33_16145 [Streptomyces sp. Root1304]KRA78926.1 hypothetical protein ASE09_20665 [Streptomyces sp. Root66D1]
MAVYAATVLAIAGVAGCSQDDTGEQSAQGVVVNLGGEIAVLKRIDAKPEIVGPRPDGTEKLDTYRLTAPRQLSSGDIVGIRDGGIVAISPDDPSKATLLGQATAWFPGVDNGKVWAVTEQSVAACEGQELPTTVRAKYSAAEHETSGHPARRVISMPCGIEPVGQTRQGIVAHQTTGDVTGSGNAARARTSVVLLDQNGAVSAVVAEGATVLAADADQIVWRADECATGACIKIYDVQARKSRNAPTCEAGDPVGSGTIAPGGRWYASAVRTDHGTHLGVLDLDEDSCQDLGAFTALDKTADLDESLAAAWSQANLLMIDQATGELIEYNAITGHVERRREALSVTNGAQVWGAHNA